MAHHACEVYLSRFAPVFCGSACSDIFHDLIMMLSEILRRAWMACEGAPL